MTGRTIFFERTRAKFLVAAGALPMKGIGPFGNFFITFIGVMAFTAGLCVGILILAKGMMTISARNSIAGIGVVGFVIE